MRIFYLKSQKDHIRLDKTELLRTNAKRYFGFYRAARSNPNPDQWSGASGLGPLHSGGEILAAHFLPAGGSKGCSQPYWAGVSDGKSDAILLPVSARLAASYAGLHVGGTISGKSAKSGRMKNYLIKFAFKI